MFEDDEQVKYCEAIVEEARSQLETKVRHCLIVSYPISRNIDSDFGDLAIM